MIYVSVRERPNLIYYKIRMLKDRDSYIFFQSTACLVNGRMVVIGLYDQLDVDRQLRVHACRFEKDAKSVTLSTS